MHQMPRVLCLFPFQDNIPAKIEIHRYSDYADMVIAGCGGYPLDATLYQSVKAMMQALKIVKEEGTILVISECSEGIGSKQFRDFIINIEDPEIFILELLNSRNHKLDQWQAQDFARVIKKARVLLYCNGIKDKDIPSHILKKVDSIEEGIKIGLKRKGSDSIISVIKDAPYVIPGVGN